jgi:MFS family permease
MPGDSFSTFLLPRVILFGIGMALLVAPLTTTVMSSVGDASSGIASGINNAVARVGGLIVIALLGLAGAGHTYRFTLALCSALAVGAGIVSLLSIKNSVKS